MADTFPLNPANVFCQGQSTESPDRTHRRHLGQGEDCVAPASVYGRLDDLRILDLKWQNSVKRMYIGSAEKRQSEFVKVESEIYAAGETAKSWGDFLSRCLQIFLKYGFVPVEW
jgi:hypothetical protein